MAESPNELLRFQPSVGGAQILQLPTTTGRASNTAPPQSTSSRNFTSSGIEISANTEAAENKGQIGRVMAAPTREEIDAKLAAVEARTETRFVELSGKMDRLSDSMAALTAVAAGVRNELAGVKSQVREENRSTRLTVGVTIIASLIAFAAALWTTQGNLLSAFQASLAVHSLNQPTPVVPNQQK